MISTCTHSTMEPPNSNTNEVTPLNLKKRKTSNPHHLPCKKSLKSSYPIFTSEAAQAKCTLNRAGSGDVVAPKLQGTACGYIYAYHCQEGHKGRQLAQNRRPLIRKLSAWENKGKYDVLVFALYTWLRHQIEGGGCDEEKIVVGGGVEERLYSR